MVAPLEIVVVTDSGELTFASASASSSGFAEAARLHVLGAATGKRVSALSFGNVPYAVVTCPVGDGMIAVIIRERTSDTPLLVRHFVQRIGQRIGSSIRRVHPKAMGMLRELDWPGNVRQLHNDVQRAMIFADGTELTPANFRNLDTTPDGGRSAPVTRTQNATTIKEAVGNIKSTLIREALKRFGGNTKKAAEELGISRSYLCKKLEQMRSRS